jgi:hypothetical protein
MQERRAGSHNHAIEILLKDVVANELLPWIGAHEGVDLGNCDAGNEARDLGYVLDIHDIGDVSTATADIDANPRLARVVFLISVLIAHCFPLESLC